MPKKKEEPKKVPQASPTYAQNSAQINSQDKLHSEANHGNKNSKVQQHTQSANLPKAGHLVNTADKPPQPKKQQPAAAATGKDKDKDCSLI